MERGNCMEECIHGHLLIIVNWYCKKRIIEYVAVLLIFSKKV